MEDYIKKIKLWFGNLKKKETSYEKNGIKPKRDWEVILIITLIILLGSAAVSGYFYYQVSNGLLFNVSSQEQENDIKINRVLLDKTIADINERRKTFDSIVQGGAVSADPSI